MNYIPIISVNKAGISGGVLKNENILVTSVI